jgi:hypothetical protein
MKLGQTPGSDGLYRWCERGILVTSSIPRYSSAWDRWYFHLPLSYAKWTKEILRRSDGK